MLPIIKKILFLEQNNSDPNDNENTDRVEISTVWHAKLKEKTK